MTAPERNVYGMNTADLRDILEIVEKTVERTHTRPIFLFGCTDKLIASTSNATQGLAQARVYTVDIFNKVRGIPHVYIHVVSLEPKKRDVVWEEKRYSQSFVQIVQKYGCDNVYIADSFGNSTDTRLAYLGFDTKNVHTVLVGNRTNSIPILKSIVGHVGTDVLLVVMENDVDDLLLPSIKNLFPANPCALFFIETCA